MVFEKFCTLLAYPRDDSSQKELTYRSCITAESQDLVFEVNWLTMQRRIKGQQERKADLDIWPGTAFNNLAIYLKSPVFTLKIQIKFRIIFHMNVSSNITMYPFTPCLSKTDTPRCSACSSLRRMGIGITKLSFILFQNTLTLPDCLEYLFAWLKGEQMIDV